MTYDVARGYDPISVSYAANAAAARTDALRFEREMELATLARRTYAGKRRMERDLERQLAEEERAVELAKLAATDQWAGEQSRKGDAFRSAMAGAMKDGTGLKGRFGSGIPGLK